MTTPWNRRYAQRTQRMGSSTIRELLKLTEKPSIISFGGGMPAPELFPVEAFSDAAARVLTRHGPAALQYGATEGYRPLREWIVSYMARYSIAAAPENILITSGSQQALDLIGKILINPGDIILTEAPTYLGALQAWNAYQAEYISVPVDRNGLQTDRLEEALSAGPKFMYILPNFQNPGGVTLSLERRRTLVEMADHYGVPIIEDDPYGELRFEGDHLEPLIVLDCDRLRQRPGHAAASPPRTNGQDANCMSRGNVIYLSTFSKTLAPGLRLAWMVAPVDVVKACVMTKQGMDLHTSSLIQMIAHETLTGGEGDFLRDHVRMLRQAYRARRDVMLSALERYFPPGCTWTHPAGGLFLWVTMPEQIDATEMLKDAVAADVAYVPGVSFYPYGRGGQSSFRLNFSYSNEERIEEGIRRLGTVVAQAIEKHAAAKQSATA